MDECHLEKMDRPIGAIYMDTEVALCCIGDVFQEPPPVVGVLPMSSQVTVRLPPQRAAFRINEVTLGMQQSAPFPGRTRVARRCP